MKRVTWSQAATDDLAGVQAHLAKFHPDIAQDTIDRLIAAARWLLGTPGGGAIVGLRRLRKRRAPKTRYILIYEPTPQGIDLVRVFHAQQNWRAVID